MRVLADEHPPEYWHANLYNEWLSSLRALSRGDDAGLPRVATTEPWGRRVLQTQLASWAELRHDTILYVKQSYTAGAACEYPDAYVDPYPEFFANIASFATRGQEVLTTLGAASEAAYFERLRGVAGTLEGMAKNQRTGAPHSAEQLAFVNQLTFRLGCGTLANFDGWYAKLFYEPGTAIEADPIVADVHTQPTDEAGNPVGKVLHVGTSSPRTMIVTVESCAGPRAYVGLVSAYREKVTEDFLRLDDAVWAGTAAGTPEVPWMADLVKR